MNIILVRHLAPDIETGMCYGRMDVPPCADSMEAGLALATTFASFAATRVWTSPSRRCRVLADAIGQSLNAAVHVDARLQELDFGEWEGKRWDDIPRAELDCWTLAPLTFSAPGGESGETLLARVRDVHFDLRKQQHDCIVVSHGGPLKILVALLRGKEPDLLAAAPPLGSIDIVSV